MTSKYEIETTAKYLMKLSYNIEGVVEVQDVIGALFGQTEGLMNDLELRELQKNGRIGRIKVENTTDNGKSFGMIMIPSSLSRNETILLAAALETVDRVGPCIAEIKLIEIKDVRHAKMDKIKERALELMKKWKENAPESSALTDELAKEMEPRVGKYNDVEVGPTAMEEEEVILVEGRADIINLFRIGVTNTIAVNGVKISPTIRELSKIKSMGAFLDGDRGGDMILSDLFQTTEIKWVARAPKGKEVENLERDELKIALENKVPAEAARKQLESEIAERAAYYADHNKDSNRRKIIEEDFEEIKHDEHLDSQDFEGYGTANNGHKHYSKPQSGTYHRDNSGYKASSVRRRGPQPRGHGDHGHDVGGRKPGQRYNKRGYDNERDGYQKPYFHQKDGKPYEPRERRNTNQDRDQKFKDFKKPKTDRQFSEAQKVKASPKIMELISSLEASNEGYLLDEKEEVIVKVPNTEIYKNIDEKSKTIIFDGVIAQRLVDRAIEAKVQKIIAVNIKNTIKIPDNASIELYKFEDFV